MKHEVAQEVAKAAPPVTVAGGHFFLDWTLSDLVLIATLAYTALLTAHLLWRWIREIRRGRK